jgi:hypothetical protein
MVNLTHYAHLREDQIPKGKLNSLLSTNIQLDANGNLSQINPNNKLLNAQEYFVTLGRLVESIQNEKGSQYGIMPARVIKVLFDKPNGLILTQKLLQHIEVGVLNEDLITAPNFEDVKIIITAGRHRLVAILTLLYYARINPSDYLNAKIRVDVRGFETEMDMLKSIISDNSSRVMKASEISRVHLTYVHNLTSDQPMTYADVCKNYEQAGRSFPAALAEMLDMHQQDNNSFLDSNSNPLSSTSFERICAGFVSKKGLSKKGQSTQKLMNLFKAFVEKLPEISRTTPTGKSGSVSGSSYTSAIIQQLLKVIHV